MQSAQQLVQLLDAGQVGRAWAGVKKALKAEPRNVELLTIAGLVALRKKMRPAAVAYLEKSVALGSQIPMGFEALAGEYAALGKAEKLDTLRSHAGNLRLKAMVSLQLALMHWQRGDLAAAQAVLEPVLATPETRSMEALNLAGVVASSDSRFEEAAALHRQAIAVNAGIADFHSNLAGALVQLGQMEAAREAVTRALELDPFHALALERASLLETSAGRIEAAKAFARRWFEAEGSAAAAAHLLTLSSPDEAAGLQAQIVKLKLDRAPEVMLAEGKLRRSAADLQGYVQLVHKANARLARSRPYEPGSEMRKGAHARQSWASLTAEQSEGKDGPVPIFIIGVMRSGTTLLERMLGNNPAVTGLGEIGILDRQFRLARARDALLSAEDLAQARQAYQALYAQKASEAGWVIDKMPINMRYAGFLPLLFPAARLIHLERAPNDVATSVFETLFDSQAQNFSFTEAGIEEHFEEHCRQRDFWQAEGVPMLSVSYEALVQAPEQEMQRIAAYCGIALTEDMLHPETNAAPIQTASLLQARAPISATSIGRWESHPDLLPALYGRWRAGWGDIS